MFNINLMTMILYFQKNLPVHPKIFYGEGVIYESITVIYGIVSEATFRVPTIVLTTSPLSFYVPGAHKASFI